MWAVGMVAVRVISDVNPSAAKLHDTKKSATPQDRPFAFADWLKADQRE
jgi:hypothetical protein